LLADPPPTLGSGYVALHGKAFFRVAHFLLIEAVKEVR